MTLGSLKPGTIGRLPTGRLVIVERVTPHAAYLISLPDQHDESTEPDGRFYGETRTISVSPYTTVYTVDTSSLSANNRDFLKRYGYECIAPEAVPKASPSETQAKIDKIKAQLAKLNSR